MEIKFVEKDDSFGGDAINYWFEIDGESYGLSLNRNDNEISVDLLDPDGCPAEGQWNHDLIKGELFSHFETIAKDDFLKFIADNHEIIMDAVYY